MSTLDPNARLYLLLRHCNSFSFSWRMISWIKLSPKQISFIIRRTQWNHPQWNGMIFPKRSCLQFLQSWLPWELPIFQKLTITGQAVKSFICPGSAQLCPETASNKYWGICIYLTITKLQQKNHQTMIDFSNLANYTRNWITHSVKCIRQRERVSLDEQMIGTKCRVGFIQYMPKKPKKFGIKVWVLCEALSGYCLQFQIYTGAKEGTSEKGLTYRVVFDLMDIYLTKNHHLYFDNFYTSLTLLQSLSRKKTYACGTLRTNRGKLPKEFVSEKLEFGDSKYRATGDVLAVHWKDKRDVFVLSTIHDSGERTRDIKVICRNQRWFTSTTSTWVVLISATSFSPIIQSVESQRNGGKRFSFAYLSSA